MVLSFLVGALQVLFRLNLRLLEWILLLRLTTSFSRAPLERIGVVQTMESVIEAISESNSVLEEAVLVGEVIDRKMFDGLEA